MKLSAVFRAQLPLLVATSLSLAAPPVSAAVTWKADFETKDLKQFSGSTNATKGTRQNIEFVSDPVQQGMVAGKFTIHEDDIFSSTQMRVQITRNGARTGEGQDVFTSFYFRVASDPMVRANIAYWETSGSNRNMMTWWLVAKAGGGTTLNFGTGNLGSAKHLFTGDVTVGQWHQIAFHVHWSTSATTGNIVFWLDGKQVVDEKTATKPDGNSLFFQAGIHRASRSTLVDTVFFDNFLEGDSVADIMIAPAGPADPDGGAPADAANSDAPVSGSGGAVGGGGGASATGGSSGTGGLLGGSGGAPGSGGASQPPSEVSAGGCAVAGGGSSIPVGAAVLLLALAARLIARHRARRA
jgi:hypothetical protein